MQYSLRKYAEIERVQLYDEEKSYANVMHMKTKNGYLIPLFAMCWNKLSCQSN